ncbi:MAG: hypothetical protein ACR2RB_21470 [Gammaproteobacteria bacterium]
MEFRQPVSTPRRDLIRIAAVGAMAALCMAHTPYRQWAVYRQRHLLIVVNKRDAPSYELGKVVAAILAEYLPASSARVTRAPYVGRVGSLIASKQLDVALLRPQQADALMRGRKPFTDYGPVALRAIAGLGEFLLVCRDDFLARHAYLLAQTLSLHAGKIAVLAPNTTVPAHEGALAFFERDALPPTANDAQ